MTKLTLRCHIWDQPSNRLFDIVLNDEVYVADLTETIRNKKGFPGDRDLSVFKVAISKQDVEPGFRVRGTPNDIEGSVMLHAQRKLEEVFKPGDELNPEDIHIIVMQRFTGMVPLTFTKSYPRAELVKALYNKLNKERLIQIRGPPASGKSALARLLASYIEKVEPGVSISYISHWHENIVKSCGSCWDWLLLHNWTNPDVASVLFIDNAQLSYWDTDLWKTYMPTITQISFPRIIVIASFGSPISDPQVNPTPPMTIDDASRVSLRHGLGSAGLLLTPKEFDEFIQHSRPGHVFDKSFLQLVYRVTGGFIGMIIVLLDIVQGHESYTLYATQGKNAYTFAVFTESIPLSDYFKKLVASLILHLILPSRQDMQYEKSKHNALRVVLGTASVHGFVTRGMLAPFTLEVDKALQLCFEKAWLHADLLHGEVGYSFPSPLHRRCVQAQLWGLADEADAHIVEKTLPEFAFNVIQLFHSPNLSADRTANAASTGIQCSPEAAYGDEFYRCCCLHTKGAVVTPPEFGSTTKSRVNLFIPQKRWGVELLCNGDHLDEYVSTSGEYGAWTRSDRGGDYIILDFCHEMPSKAHPGVSNLYRVIVNKDSRDVLIFDNELKPVVNKDSSFYPSFAGVASESGESAGRAHRDSAEQQELCPAR
ncbi:hypothetical protein BDN72DRAFT_903011 [Pluteus cervinus]|uniref:Uncharacterized protein n=1 Tax=Pluteus cervinus TaxID=181527 RepID=A0ACD3AA15_9AGAR|nr:hypothetical protein BDN72DRAFT_903011 [Pluteus cervinus]